MKIFGIVLLVFAALNFIVMLIAIWNGAPSEAVNGKLSAVVLLGLVGGGLYYYGIRKEKS